MGRQPTLFAVAVALATSTANPGSASAQGRSISYLDSPSEQVRQQIETYQLYSGFDYSHETIVRSLLEGETHDITYWLAAGTTYVFYGACDSDCGDLDFELYDPDGALATEDRAVDPSPVVVVTPWYSGTYRLNVDMYSCFLEPCFFGVGAFVN